MEQKDPLLEKARQAEALAQQGAAEAASAAQEARPKNRVVRFLLLLFRGLKKLGQALKWASFKRNKEGFITNPAGKLMFSPARLGKVVLVLILVCFSIHAGFRAIYFYSTRFEEVVYTTGKQEILTGERYQFTGCTSLPCSTDLRNGKFYMIESSWYLPYLLYPEEDVFSNIPQQDGACYVKGYGLYIKELKALHRRLQWYQHVYSTSCRPYTEEEKQKAVLSSHTEITESEH